MRLDRAATLFIFHPVARGFTRDADTRVSVLMYHSVSNEDEESVHPYYQVSTTPRRFEEQMKLLKDEAYAVVPLADVARAVESGEVPGQNCVAITFDDGYHDFLSCAFPVLCKYGFPATVFLPTAFIGDAPQVFKNKECLTWSEVQELHKAGVVFGSHTVSHPQLHSVSPSELEREVRASKAAIEDRLGSAIDSFSYPYAFPEQDGEFKRRLRNLLEVSGYRHGVSTIIGTLGPKDDRFFLKRLPVNSRDDARFFRAKLEGGYNWLHVFQYATKLIKSKAL